METVTDRSIYLKPAKCVDSDASSIRFYAQQMTKELNTKKQKAIALYYAVRDGWQYYPYEVTLDERKLKASHVLNRESKRGHCIDKACLLAALVRTIGIPSRLCFGSVINHIGTGKVEKLLKTNVLAFHGYVELFLEGKWVKATPAFNKELCERLNVAPLEFDGKTDSLFQEYDQQQGKFMEYIEEYGHFDDIPIELMAQTFIRYYPHLETYLMKGYLTPTS